MPQPDERDPVEMLAEEYLERLRRGEHATVDEYAREHPEIADEVRELFPALAAMEDAASNARYEGPRAVAGYTIERELGRGGQGTVFLARDQKLSRRVALKVLSASVGAAPEEQLARFRREAEATARIEHPGVCAVYEAGEADGVHFIAMRYLEGKTLAQLLTDARSYERADATIGLPELSEDVASKDTSTSGGSRRDVTRVVALFEEVARALHATHEHGLVHRDVKPSNIMLSGGKPVLLDLGLAHVEDAGTLTQSGDLLGTPAYMSPEQISGSSFVDHRTDVYSLGVALYECLTLERPFGAPTREGIYRRILEERPRRASRLNPRVPRDLDVILETTLEKERERRYASALELAEDLHRLRHFQPIRARRANFATRLVRWSQRNRLAAAFIVVLAFGLAATTVLLRRIQSAAAALEAQDQTKRALLAARAARDTIEVNPLVALALAREAVGIERSAETLSAVQEALAGSHEVACFRHGGMVHAAVPSKDGRLLLTASGDELATLRDLESGVEVTRFEGHTGSVEFAAFSRDESLVLTGSSDGTLRLWSLDGVESAMCLHGSRIRSASFVEQRGLEPRVLTGASDGRAVLWDLGGGSVREFRAAGPGTHVVAEFSPESELLVTAPVQRGWGRSHEEKTVRAWRLDGTRVAELQLNDLAWSITFSPDGGRVSIGCLDGTAYVWNPITGDVTEFGGHGFWVREGRYSPDGELFVTVSDDTTARLWRAADGKLIRELIGHERAVTDVAFSPDSQWITTISDDQTARVWSIDGTEVATMRGHSGAEMVRSVHFIPETYPPRFVTSCQDETARVWELWDPELPVYFGHRTEVNWAAFDPQKDWRWFVTIGGDGRVLRVDPDGRSKRFDTAGKTRGYWVDISRNGEKVVLNFKNEGVEVWDVETMKLDVDLGYYGFHVGTVEFSPVSDTGLLLCMARRVYVYDNYRGAPTAFFEFTESALGASWAPDGKSFVVSHSKGSVTHVPLEGNRVAPWEAHEAGYVWMATYSPSSNSILSGGSDFKAKLWTLEGELSRTFVGAPQPLVSAVFSPTGDHVLGASTDARLWTLDGELELVLRGHRRSLVGAIFTPDGKQVLTFSHDHSARLWPVDADRLLEIAERRSYRPFDDHENAYYEAALATSPVTGR